MKDMQTQAVIEARDVQLVFQTTDGPVQAPKDVNLTVNKGDFVSFIGPSGCGKTTLLRSIAALENVTGGSLSVNKMVPDAAPRAYGYVFRAARLYPWRTITGCVMARAAGINARSTAPFWGHGGKDRLGGGAGLFCAFRRIIVANNFAAQPGGQHALEFLTSGHLPSSFNYSIYKGLSQFYPSAIGYLGHRKSAELKVIDVRPFKGLPAHRCVIRQYRDRRATQGPKFRDRLALGVGC